MKAIGLVLVLLAVPVCAQEPVNHAADVISWGTAAVNPAIAVVQAIRSDDTKCKLGQLAISEAIGNGIAFAGQHWIVSPRPCCAGNGWPSAHAVNAMLGGAWNWRVSWSLGVSTAALRVQAHRHTWPQVLSGVAIGGLSELAGQKLLRCHE